MLVFPKVVTDKLQTGFLAVNKVSVKLLVIPARSYMLHVRNRDIITICRISSIGVDLVSLVLTSSKFKLK